jgi:hypothetical protein
MEFPECDCPEPTGSFWCERHQRRKTPGLWELCRTRPDYRRLWESQRDVDSQAPRHTSPPAPWLTCEHRGETMANLPGATLGTGCRTAQQPVYRCGHFGEPVAMRAATSHRERIAAEIPDYTGRTCQRCEIPTCPTD